MADSISKFLPYPFALNPSPGSGPTLSKVFIRHPGCCRQTLWYDPRKSLLKSLARATGDPAFDPDPITAADLAGWLGRIREEARMTFEQLRQSQCRLPESARLLAERVLESWGAAATWTAPVEALALQAMKTRYHGDYHLGQVLVAEDDVVIIDFEGEPSRSMAARRGKHSPLRDVVGMLRSFNYAAHAALRQATADGARDRTSLLPQVNDWEQQTRSVFLDSYAEAAGGSPGYPTDSDQARMLLDLFTLEKACCELRYELDNRPDWVAIPLGGLCGLLTTEVKMGCDETIGR